MPLEGGSFRGVFLFLSRLDGRSRSRLSGSERRLVLALLGGGCALLDGLAEGESDLSLVLINLDDLDVNPVAGLDDRGWRVDLVVSQLGNVEQALKGLGQLDEHAEVGDLGHDTFDDGPDGEVDRDLTIPGVFLELLHTEGNPLLVLVDRDHDRLDLLAALENFARVHDFLGPAQVADVKETVDPLLKLDEGAVVGQVADDAADLLAWRILVVDQGPGVDLDLLHAERDLLLLRVHVEDYDLDLVADLDDLAGVVDPLGPRHFADVNEALDALLELHERAVAEDVDHGAGELGTDGVLGLNVGPR